MFEYVTRQGSLPIRKKVEEAIRKVHLELRQFGIKFNHRLVGSAGRNMITRIKGGNLGYDLDYDLDLIKISEELWGNPKKVKQIFIDAFNKYGFTNKDVENSKSVFSMKKVDKNKGKILYSFDFAVNRYINRKGEITKESIYFNKKSSSNNDYIWRSRENKIDYGVLEQKIKKAKQWQKVREKYLINKNKEPNKKSRIVYYETLKWVYENIVIK